MQINHFYRLYFAVDRTISTPEEEEINGEAIYILQILPIGSHSIFNILL